MDLAIRGFKGRNWTGIEKTVRFEIKYTYGKRSTRRGIYSHQVVKELDRKLNPKTNQAPTHKERNVNRMFQLDRELLITDIAAVYRRIMRDHQIYAM